MGQHAQAAAVRHPDHHLARALVGRVAEDHVEHRHHGIEALDAESLLAQVRSVEEPLQRLDGDQPLEQRDLVFGLHRPPMLTRLDDLAQPDALLVRADVLDLVGDRAAVRLLEVGERLGQRGAGHVDAQQLGRDAGHQLRRQAQRFRVEGRVAHRLRAQRIQVRAHVPEMAIGLHQRHTGRDRLEPVTVVAGARVRCRCRCRCGEGAATASAGDGVGSSVVTSAARAPMAPKASA